MDALEEYDVPYGNDWDNPTEAAAYGDAADQVRPWRAQVRDHIAARVATLAPRARVLELGSGPGLLAQRVLQGSPGLETYTLLDFSEAMLALSRERLSGIPAASFVRASFKSDDWPRQVNGRFDCVLSMQAIHELRHKRHAKRVYGQAYDVLTDRGTIMICDHTPLDDSAKSAALYMSQAEQQAALLAAGFANVRVELAIDTLVVYGGERVA